jgi:hypothetical protein
VFGSRDQSNPYVAAPGRAPSMAGQRPFGDAYARQLEDQYRLHSQISASAAEAEASKYKTAPNPPKSSSSFADGLAGPLTGVLGQLSKGLINSAFSGGGASSFSSGTPWNFNSGLNFLPSGSSAIASNFSSAGINGPSFSPTTLNFLK